MKHKANANLLVIIGEMLASALVAIVLIYLIANIIVILFFTPSPEENLLSQLDKEIEFAVEHMGNAEEYTTYMLFGTYDTVDADVLGIQSKYTDEGKIIPNEICVVENTKDSNGHYRVYEDLCTVIFAKVKFSNPNNDLYRLDGYFQSSYAEIVKLTLVRASGPEDLKTSQYTKSFEYEVKLERVS